MSASQSGGYTEHAVNGGKIPETIYEAEIEECWWNDDDRPREGDAFVSPVKGVGKFYYHAGEMPRRTIG